MQLFHSRKKKDLDRKQKLWVWSKLTSRPAKRAGMSGGDGGTTSTKESAWSVRVWALGSTMLPCFFAGGPGRAGVVDGLHPVVARFMPWVDWWLAVSCTRGKLGFAHVLLETRSFPGCLYFLSLPRFRSSQILAHAWDEDSIGSKSNQVKSSKSFLVVHVYDYNIWLEYSNVHI